MRSNRHDRRIARRQIVELNDRARKVRAELFESVELLAKNDAMMSGEGVTDELRASHESLRRDVRVGIETYVDALGQLASVDDRATSPAFREDASFYCLLASQNWCGTSTAEQAREALLEEVTIRSVGKSELGILLSSIDQTAFRLYGTMPEALVELHGEPLVESIVERLKGDEFNKVLYSDSRWSAMRKRWIWLGWRGTNKDNFDAAFIRAAAERTAEIHDRKGEGDDAGDFAIRDTILDGLIERERPEMRAKMMRAFADRLSHEWELILSQRASRVAGLTEGGSIKTDTTGRCPFCGGVVSVRWGDPPIDPGNLVHAEPTCTQFNTMTADEFVRTVIDRRETQNEFFLESGDTPKVPIEVSLNRDDVRRLDAIADRWGTDRDGAVKPDRSGGSHRGGRSER